MLNHTAGGKSDSESREDLDNSEEDEQDYEAGYYLDSDAEDAIALTADDDPATILGKMNQMKDESAQLQSELTETKSKMDNLEKENQKLKKRTEQCDSPSSF